MIEKDLNLIRKITWSFVKKYPGMEFEDTFGEACFHYLRAIPEYDPEKGAKSTYLWRFITNELKIMLGGEMKKHNAEESVPEVLPREHAPGPEQVLINKERWEEFVDSLSPEAKVIYDIVIARADVDIPTDKPKLARGEIMRTLRDEGWTWRSIWSGFREVKEALAT